MIADHFFNLGCNKTLDKPTYKGINYKIEQK